MSPVSGFGMFAVLLAAGLSASPGLAKNEGQEDLDKATQAKLNVKTLSDLTEVIRLCDSALKKGLDEENTRFANKLLAATLIQRGATVTKAVFESAPLDPQWQEFRRAALNDLERAAKLDPEQPEALLRIAQLNLLGTGDQKRAAQALDEAIRLAKDQVALKAEALVLRSEIQKDPAKQLADLNEAVQLAPGDAQALRARGALLADRNKLEPGLADLESALKIDPRHVPTLEAKAMVLGRMKKFDQAEATLDLAEKLRPKSIGPLLQRARIRALKPDYQAALAALEEAFSRDPGNARVMLMRATIYQEMKDDAKALAEVDRLLELKPGLELAMRFRAVLLAGAGKFDEAIGQVEELLQADPEDVESRLQLGMLYSGNHRHRKAILIFSEILAKDPENWSALRGRGDARLGIGQHAEAIADYEKAYKLRPDDSGLLNNFAWVLATSPDDKLRNGKRALELAQEAARLTDHQQAHILSTLAAAYAETGDFETALKWSQKAVDTGKDEQKADLAKELESYKAKKPFRELKNEEESEGKEPPAKAKPGDKPDPKKSKPPRKRPGSGIQV